MKRNEEDLQWFQLFSFTYPEKGRKHREREGGIKKKRPGEEC